jgi:RecA/RadA recombinase
VTGIQLGDPLDALLNRDGVGPGKRCGILLPGSEDEPTAWSGNIVICGKAGSGKSTLALQMAVACTSGENRCSAGYISLEEAAEGVLRKARGFEWQEYVREVHHLHLIDDPASPEQLAFLLAEILTKPERQSAIRCRVEAGRNETLPLGDGCRKRHDQRFPTRRKTGEHHEEFKSTGWEPYVWLFSLSPASLVTGRNKGALFTERYRQLERLLMAISTLNRLAREGHLLIRNRPLKRPVMPVVCVDSLNVFGSEEPVREEYHRLFDLFHRHGIVGVFTVEAGTDTPFDSTMADVVIRLSSEQDQGYVVQYLEVEKSRYLAQSGGRHTFKILSPKKGNRDGDGNQTVGTSA